MRELLLITAIIIGIGGIVKLQQNYTADQMYIAVWDVDGDSVETRWLAGTNGELEFRTVNPNAKLKSYRYENYTQPRDTGDE